ncbi:MAG: nucleotidyltransferase substrate binding protein [Candidatus Babeliaceae bacterium]|nr:nucleotidyltransferase substrate binding protein [Candidatus Babeliaceae bacterium]
MELLKERKTVLDAALRTLVTALDDANKFPADADEEDYRRHRDSTIQRFEYCTDLFWKYLKFFMEKEHGVTAKSPKSAIREAVAIELISGKEGELALQMIDARNNTAYIYREAIAEQIYQQVPYYFNLIMSVLKRLKQ